MRRETRPSPARVLAAIALSEFRTREEMRFADGWVLRYLALELREHRPAYAFMLECWRTSPEECDPGDRVYGYVRDGTVNVEQYA